MASGTRSQRFRPWTQTTRVGVTPVSQPQSASPPPPPPIVPTATATPRLKGASRGAAQPPPPPPLRPASVETSVRVTTFNIFAGKNFLIGICAHFFLVLVVATVQSLIAGTPHASVNNMEPQLQQQPLLAASASMDHHGDWSHWMLVILVLMSALFFVALSYLTRVSWPVVSEKGIITALVWMLYGALIQNFGICMCCEGGPWYATCGGIWYEQLFSLLWLVALVTSYLVDARMEALRRISLMLTLSMTVLLFLAPLNACSALPTPNLVMFLKITLFHLIWHANRFQRIAEVTLYGMEQRNVKSLNGIRVHPRGMAAPTADDVEDMDDNGSIAFAHPSDMLTHWDVMKKLAVTLQEEVTPHQLIVGNRASPASASASMVDRPALFIESVNAARRAMPALDDYSSVVNWRYRDYNYNLMIIVDLVRSVWVLGVCWPYLVVALFELAWIYAAVYKACDEIIFESRSVHMEAEYIARELALDTTPSLHPHRDGGQ